MEITNLHFTGQIFSCDSPIGLKFGDDEKTLYIENLQAIVHGDDGLNVGRIMLAVPGSTEFGVIWPKDCNYLTVNGCYLIAETGSIEMTENLKTIARQNSTSIAETLKEFGVPCDEMPL